MPYMQRVLLGFCGGALVLGLPWPGGPALVRGVMVAGAAGVVVAALLLVRRRPAGRWQVVGLGLAAGLAFSGAAHTAALAARVDPQGGAVTLTGRVISQPVVLDTAPDRPAARRFHVLVLSDSAPLPVALAGQRLRISWYGAPEVARGEVWRWRAVVRGPWSHANPGGFDYERWLLGVGLQGTGYVRSGQRLERAAPGALERARAHLRRLLERVEPAHEGVLLALLLGDSSAIGEPLWQTFRATGTVHLMVISGLHVSLAAALGFAAGRTSCRLCPWLPLWLDARIAGCLGGAALSGAYVALAGAGLPALRALVMSGATLALLAGARTARLGATLLVALAGVLLVQPLAIHRQGFWLSFGAVAILYLALGHRRGGSRLAVLARGQLALSLGMLPLVALTTGTLPWVGAPANLLAVPAMSLAVVPLVLAAAVAAWLSADVAGWLLLLADLAVGGVVRWLEWLALVPLPTAPGCILALLLAQAAVLLALPGTPRAYLPGLVLCGGLPLLSGHTGVAQGAYRITALDVGQGTAVVVDTRRHRLLYDAGPAFPGGFDAGSAVVVPSIAATGPPRLDVAVFSHDDLDHVGGGPAVLASLAPARVLGPPRSWGPPCGPEQWDWDGVRFRLLQVDRPPEAGDNDRSCILLVDDGRRAALLAGDIGAQVEGRLLRRLAAAGQAVHLMFAPHHGSRSSSSRALVRVLRPRLVIVSAARGNRFGHPHPEVVARYRRGGARLLQTGWEGALIWESRTDALTRWRRERAPYWRGWDSPAGGG